MWKKDRHFVLTLSCPDSMGIVARVCAHLGELQCFIDESANFSDTYSKNFFMRTCFYPQDDSFDPSQFGAGFEEIAKDLSLTWRLHNLAERQKVVIMVSKFDHCLNDLLYRYRTGDIRMDIPAIISNHPDLQSLSEWHGIPFYHVPVTPGTKPAAEARMKEIVNSVGADCIVLARYMQILTDDVCNEYSGRIINIHHSALPSFKGAKPYHRAFERGVKVVGATAHYVTADLDEGPIIEQQLEHVEHFHSAEEMMAKGRDVESLTLAKALRFHLQHRVFLNGGRTVVFRR